MQNMEVICKKYAINVYKYLFCLTHSYDISEELTQETMYRALKNIDKLRENDKIEFWLCKIAKNLWLQEIKKNKNKIMENAESVLNNIQTNEEVLDIIIKNEQVEYLKKKINKLDENSKVVFDLRIIGNLKFKNIANIMGKTENWARVTFYRAKQQIIKEVHEDEQRYRM